MADRSIDCSSSPTPYVCADPEPEPLLATPSTIGPPPDPATARRLEQALVEERMQKLADGGMSTNRGTSAAGKVPLATTMQPRAELRKQYEALVEARKHEKPIEHDPIGQALPTLPLSIAQGLAHGAYGVAKHVLEHALYDVVEHTIEHKLHEHEVQTRERNESRDVQPAPAAVRIRG